MKMKLTSALTVLALLINVASAKAQQDTSLLSFDEAVLISLENNFGVKEASSHAEMKQKELKAKRGMFLPTVSIAASYVHMSDDLHMDLNPIKESITPLYTTLGNYGNFSGVPNPDPNTNAMMPILPDDISTEAVREQLLQGAADISASDWTEVLQEQNFGFVNANVSLPIYAGGKVRSSNKAASIYYDEALNELEIKKMVVIDELVERYFGLVLAQEALDVRKQVLQTMNIHLHNAQRLKEEGVIANAEFLHVKVYHSDAEREMKKAERQVSIAREALQNTLSAEKDLPVLPITNLFISDSIQPLSYFKDQAQLNSKFLKKVELKQALVETKHHVEKGNFMPTIAAMGTYQLAEYELSPLVPKYMVGIGLNWTIFDGAARMRELKASKYQTEEVDFIYKKTNNDIETALTKYYQELHMYMDEYEDLQTAYAFALEYYRVREKGFKQGVSTASELSDANLAKAKVEIDMLQTKYNYDKSLSKLLYYSGLSFSFNEFRIMSTEKDNINTALN